MNPTTIFREATLDDIPQMSVVRMSVRENILSNPALVTHADYVAHLTQEGKGWVAEIDGEIVGLSIVNRTKHNVWALFIHPDFERQGIGRRLHDLLLDWYFLHESHPIWLSTSPATRAADFYRKAGWMETGVTQSGELKFEMERAAWIKA